MKSSRQLSIIFLSLSGIIVTLLACFSVWVMTEEEHLKLTIPGGILLTLLFSFLVAIPWGYKHIIRLIGVREDEKIKVEQKLIGYSARLRSFIENPKYVSIFSLDKNYCYTGFNSLHEREMERVFKVHIEEGSSILQAYPPELAERAKVNFDRALKGEHFTVTSLFKNRYYTQIFNPVHADDQITGLTCNIVDVTERIRAEQEVESYKDQLEFLVKERTEQLERQTMFFQKIIDNLPNLIFVRDVNHRYILVNQAMADSFGCKKEDLIGESLSGTHHNFESARQFALEDEKLIQHGGVVEEEGQHTWPNGATRWLFLSKRRVEIEEDQYVLGVHFDITYLKDTEHKLQRANDELKQTLNKLRSAQLRLIESEKMASLGQLTAGLAHEINNPLNYVAGNVAPIREDLRELRNYIRSLEKFKRSAGESASVGGQAPNFEMLFEELESLLAGVDEGTARVKSLMRDLNMFSLPEGSGKVLCDINESLQSTVNLVRHHLKSRIKLVRNFGSIPKTLCNPQQLNQVFLNVLNNAIQAIDGPGQISVDTQAKANQIAVTISDTGTGIPQENLGRIFDPFFTTKQVGEGTGLGLAISYRIIKDHGGEINVESTVNKGTTFSIRLPVVSVS